MTANKELKTDGIKSDAVFIGLQKNSTLELENNADKDGSTISILKRNSNPLIYC